MALRTALRVACRPGACGRSVTSHSRSQAPRINRCTWAISRPPLQAVCFKADDEDKQKSASSSGTVKNQAETSSGNVKDQSAAKPQLAPSTSPQPGPAATAQKTPLQSLSYGLLGLIVAATSAGALLLPDQTAQTLFGVTLDAVSKTMMRSLGAMLIIVAAIKFSLQSAAVRDRMSAEIHRRLNSGLMAWAAGVLVVLAQALSLQNTAMALSLGIVGGATLLLSGASYAISKGGLPIPNPKALVYGVASLVLPRSASSAAYSAICVLFLLKTWMLMGTYPGAASPLFAVDNTPVTILLFRLSGVSALLAAVAAFCLRDTAEQQQLDMPTARTLNLGLAAQALAQAAVMGVGVAGGSVLPSNTLSVMTAVCVAIFAWCMYNFSV